MCRFHYPQLPSQRTIITRPPEIPEHIPYWLKLRASLLKDVREEIEKSNIDSQTTKTLNDILQARGIREELYQEALAITNNPTVIIKRETTDLWTNNYNPDILRTWRGNIDIQYITDVYACIMYIVSYACKAENSMSDIIQQVAKESSNEVFRTQMKKVAATFLNHQEISAQEAAYRLLSLYLKKCQGKWCSWIQMKRTTEYVSASHMKKLKVRKMTIRTCFLHLFMTSTVLGQNNLSICV